MKTLAATRRSYKATDSDIQTGVIFCLITFKIKDHRLAGFFHSFARRSIDSLTRTALVSFRFADTIHSTYSFRLVNERLLKNVSSFFAFLKAAARSSGKWTVFFTGSIKSKIG